MLTIGSLFSGIGGLELGLEWAGLGPVLWQVEKDSYCLKVLEKHWQGVRRYENVKTIGRSVAPVDLICGGFPCQDVSSAGKRAGLSGARSGLWYEFARIIEEVNPRWIVVENVASGAKLWVDPVRRGLEQRGYVTFPVPMSAFDVGAPHLRRRVFIIGHTNSKSKPDGTKYAEVAQLSKHPSNTQCDELRDESRRSSRQARPCEAELGNDGEEKSLADGNGERLEGPEQQRKRNSEQPRTSVESWWSTEPNVGRVADGVPARTHRLRALGNAVVPQCAQVIGEIIKELMK